MGSPAQNESAVRDNPRVGSRPDASSSCAGSPLMAQASMRTGLDVARGGEPAPGRALAAAPNDEDEKVMQGRCVSERGAGKQRAFERL